MRWRRRKRESGSEKEGGREKKREADREKAYLLACRQQFFFRARAVCTGIEGKYVPLQAA